jgi:hypothetical protein
LEAHRLLLIAHACRHVAHHPGEPRQLRADLTAD